MTRLLVGATYPLRGLRLLLRDPVLRRLAVIPLAVNLFVGLVLGIGLALLGLRLTAPLVDRAGGAGVLVQVLVVLLVLAGSALLLVRLAVVIGGPWYSRMSEHVLALHAVPPGATRSVPAELLAAAGLESRKLVLVVVLGAGVLLCGLIPAAGPLLALLGSQALAATLACLDFLAGPQDRRRLGLRARLGEIRAGLPTTLGFGLVAGLLSAVPVVNLVAIPVCVVGGALLWIERLAPAEGRPGSAHRHERERRELEEEGLERE